jgi:hypothetical protein
MSCSTGLCLTDFAREWVTLPEPHRLAVEAQAEDIERTFDAPGHTAAALVGDRRWLGPDADRVRAELRQTGTRLGAVAGALRDRAKAMRRRAQHLEDTDTAAGDIRDFLTERDYTPWF